MRTLCAALFALASAAAVPASAQLNIQTVASGINQPIGVAPLLTESQLLVSLNWPNGQPYNFASVNSAGVASQFGTASGLLSEVKLATVFENSGGFNVGDVFATSEFGWIYQFQNNGSSTSTTPTLFATLPGVATYAVLGIFKDRFNVVGGNLVVTSNNGNVYTITSGGVVTMIASTGYPLEGITTIPNDPKYGPLAGKILVGVEHTPQILVMAPDGTYQVLDLSSFGLRDLEGFRVVPACQNWYGIDYAHQRVVGVAAADWAPYVGDIYIVDEGGADAGGLNGRLFDVKVTGTTLDPSSFNITEITQNPAATVGQFEQTVFTTVGIGPIATANCSGALATRTWGFWKTHPDLMTQAVNNGCINLGVLQVAGGGTEDLTNPTIGQIEAILWASPGKGTSALGQARLQLAHQLIAAEANACMFGTNSTITNLINLSVAALDGFDTSTMISLAGQLGAYNTGGDTTALPSGIQPGSANPNGAKSLATSAGPAFQ